MNTLGLGFWGASSVRDPRRDAASVLATGIDAPGLDLPAPDAPGANACVLTAGAAAARMGRRRMACGHLGLVLLLIGSLLTACGHAPSSPESAGETGAGATDAALTGSEPQDKEPLRADRGGLWPHGSQGDTLAVFPPLRAAERLGLASEHWPDAVYTYVLYGLGDGRSAQQNRPWRHTEQELLRLIDTYVIGASEVADPGSPAASHEFLVPVYVGLDSLPLTERSAPDLADAAREALAARLETQNQTALASRLRSAPGPFLVSRTTPELLPEAGGAPLLLTDLSSLGPEYLYPLVDAYDRPVPESLAGTPAALRELRQRLARLGSTSGQRGDQGWVHFLEPAAGAATVATSRRGS